MIFPPIVDKIIDIVISAGAAQGFFLGMLLTARKNRRKPANKILASLLAVLSVSILHSILASPAFHSPYVIREPFILIIGPLLTFYVYELIGFRKIVWKDSLHFLPFVILIFFVLPVWTSTASPYAEFLRLNGLIISKIIWTLIVFQFGYYWSNILSVLHNHRTAVESEFSNIEGKTLSWVKFFLHVFGMFLFVLVLTLVIAFHSDQYESIDTIVCFGLSCAIFALGHNGLFQDEIFSLSAAEAQQPEKSLRSPQNKLEMPPEPREDEQWKKLETHLEKSKPYLNESLTLTQLAEQLGITRNQLSALINNRHGNNFYSFINMYRVEEVKRLISDPKNSTFTILSLAHDAGFPSKSSFQAIFKKFTGLTPTEYRKNLR